MQSLFIGNNMYSDFKRYRELIRKPQLGKKNFFKTLGTHVEDDFSTK